VAQADRFDGGERAAAREHRQSAEEALLVRGQEVVAPRDPGAQGPETLRLVLGALRQHLQATRETREQGTPGGGS
jgi:hypothetical protein